MRVVILVSLFLFLATAFCFAQNNESLTITTYYPSPYGSYNELRAHQMGIGTSAAYFTGALPANSLIVEGNVGIGTAAPAQKLDVVGTIRASTDVCLTSGTCLSSVAGGSTAVYLCPNFVPHLTGLCYSSCIGQLQPTNSCDLYADSGYGCVLYSQQPCALVGYI